MYFTMTTIKSRVMMRCLFIFLNAIGISGGLKAQAPVITSFSPTSAIPGASVTLTGTGFNTATTNNIVFFGATRATVTA
ncbi:MAG: IPT/TIG domain-containing protein, partial [Chitinophagaceae bacterium]